MTYPSLSVLSTQRCDVTHCQYDPFLYDRESKIRLQIACSTNSYIEPNNEINEAAIANTNTEDQTFNKLKNCSPFIAIQNSAWQIPCGFRMNGIFLFERLYKK